MFQVLKAIFEWFIVIAIVYGVVSNIIYEYQTRHILAIVPIAFPLLLALAWLYYRLPDIIKEKIKQRQEQKKKRQG